MAKGNAKVSAQSARSSALQAVKDRLVRQGTGSVATRLALRLYGLRRGLSLQFENGAIAICRAGRRMLIDQRQVHVTPSMIDDFDRYFDWIEPKVMDGIEVLDFSSPGFHYNKTAGIGFNFPNIPEGLTLESYTHWYSLRAGDVVFDLGAHAGVTAYLFSKAVGPTGRVIAFEPDEVNHAHLKMNIARHGLHNVVPVKKAIAAVSGNAMFNMDGTMAAGLSRHLIYTRAADQVSVETLSLEDACTEYGVPDFAKVDIEGAEVEVIRGAMAFLSNHRINFAFESLHRLPGGELTYRPLEELFRSLHYEVASSSEFGDMFTWARPASGRIAGPVDRAVGMLQPPQLVS